MLEDNKNKDTKGFSFIQEQVASKKKGRLKKMLFSAVWTIVLGCIFGIAAGVAFCVSEPAIYKLLGRNDNKKRVEFPSATPDDIKETTDDTDKTNNLPGGNEQGGKTEDNQNPDDKEGVGESETDKEEGTEPIIIEKHIPGNLKDLASIYGELRGIANQLNRSLVTVNSISNEIDWFKNELELAKTTTGLVIGDNGAELLILTSYDKIKDAKEIQVTLFDSTRISASLLGYDTELNLSALAVKLDQIPESQLKYIQAANLGESYLATVGTPVLALGAPNGYVGSFEFGMISNKLTGVYITDNKVDIFHTDITYNENSEGVIANLEGEVIGVITQSLKDDENQEINTVLGISKIKKIIERLVNNQEQVYFGIKAEDMTDAALKQLELTNGIYVTEVQANSPALESGLQSGDVILAIDDTTVLSVQAFQNTIGGYKSKSSIKVLVHRTTKSGTKDIELNVVLGVKSE